MSDHALACCVSGGGGGVGDGDIRDIDDALARSADHRINNQPPHNSTQKRPHNTKTIAHLHHARAKKNQNKNEKMFFTWT